MDHFLSACELKFFQRNPRATAIKAVAKADKLDLQIVDTDAKFRESADYRKLNKLGKIPTFEGSDGYVLSEAIAIAIYGKTINFRLVRR